MSGPASSVNSSTSGLVCGPTRQLGGPIDTVNIYGGTLDGNRADQPTSLGSCAGLYCISATRVRVRDMRSINWRGDGLYFGGDTTAPVQGKSVFIFLENVPTNIQKRAANGCGTRFSCVGVPNRGESLRPDGDLHLHVPGDLRSSEAPRWPQAPEHYGA